MKWFLSNCPEIDRALKQGEDAAVIESVKAAGEIKSPISGVVIEVNDLLNDTPETVNDDPDGQGWVYKIKPADVADLEGLMDLAAYESLLETLA